MSRDQTGRNGTARKEPAPARLPLGEERTRPTFRRERSALKRGVWPIAGCDEAGRGPLAGPVVAAAVILNPEQMDANHLYVAMTRGARSLVICSDTAVLHPG